MSALPAARAQEGLAGLADLAETAARGGRLEAGFLLLRRQGGLWGIDSGAVAGLARRGGRFRVQVAGGVLEADEIVGVIAALAVHPLGALLRRFWPDAAAGWAIHDSAPVVVVDPRFPPRALTSELPPALPSEQGELPDGDD